MNALRPSRGRPPRLRPLFPIPSALKRMVPMSLPALLALLPALASGPGPVDFAREVWPLLEARCHRCHGPDEQKGGLRLDERRAALEGGRSGKVIVPGRSAESRLFKLVAGEDPK